MAEPIAPDEDPPAFTEEFRLKVALGKYTRWATELTEGQLIAVLWAVGEFGRRSEPVMECLDRHAEEFFPCHGLPRARMGLELLSAMSDRELFSMEQVIARAQAVMRDWRASLGIPQE